MSDYYSKPIATYLRKPPKTLARSAYAVEINPWVPRADIEAALSFRGTIVSALAYIEGSLGDIAIRCSRVEIYSEIRSEFPHTLTKKTKFLRKVFQFGPLQPYRSWADQFLNRVEAYSELRNLVAHARMQVMPDCGVTFQHYPRNTPREAILERKRLTMEELELVAWKAARLSRLFQRLYNHLETQQILPPLEV